MSFVGPWFWGAIACLLLASHAGVAWWVRADVNEKWELREAKTKEAASRAISMEQAKQREIEGRWQERVNSAEKELNDARMQIDLRDRSIAGLRTDAHSLRDQLAAYASRASKDPGAAGPATLATVAADGADLLSEGAGLLRACARDHDERAAEVAALLAAWPR